MVCVAELTAATRSSAGGVGYLLVRGRRPTKVAYDVGIEKFVRANLYRKD